VLRRSRTWIAVTASALTAGMHLIAGTIHVGAQSYGATRIAVEGLAWIRSAFHRATIRGINPSIAPQTNADYGRIRGLQVSGDEDNISLL
nr:hypothetical protein [Chloroflexota bacterium]